MLIKGSILDIIRESILDKGNVKDFMDAIREKFKESDNAETTNLMSFL